MDRLKRGRHKETGLARSPLHRISADILYGVQTDMGIDSYFRVAKMIVGRTMRPMERSRDALKLMMM